MYNIGQKDVSDIYSIIIIIEEIQKFNDTALGGILVSNTERANSTHTVLCGTI